MTNPAQMQLLLWIDMGWISFVVLCCFLPMACRHRRRREEARVARRNSAAIRSGLAEIMDHAPSGGEKDWERLQRLLELVPMRGIGRTDDGGADDRDPTPSSSRCIPFDALTRMGYAGRDDDDVGKKKESARRFVAALKATSAKVTESDLIAKAESDVETGIVAAADGEGDDDERKSENDEIIDDEEVSGDATVECERGRARSEVEVEYGNVSKECDDVKESSRSTLGSDARADEKSDASVEDNAGSPTRDAFSEISSATNGRGTAPAHYNPAAAADSVAVAVPINDPRDASSQSTNPSDSDDDHDEYDESVALRLPRTSSPDVVLEEPRRLVPATCAICLGRYGPGCIVSWSSNEGCAHAFHRDCVFAWMLRKGCPECPCCRGAFVVLEEEKEPGDDANG